MEMKMMHNMYACEKEYGTLEEPQQAQWLQE